MSNRKSGGFPSALLHLQKNSLGKAKTVLELEMGFDDPQQIGFANCL